MPTFYLASIKVHSDFSDRSELNLLAVESYNISNVVDSTWLLNDF